jgi:tRNA-binding protein
MTIPTTLGSIHPDGGIMNPAPVKPEISIDMLEKVDIRVGTIASVTEVPDSKKLMKLTVDFGDHWRSILAGVKQERDDPHRIVGLQALFVVNLAPRKMAGEVSEGMLFDVGYADGVTPALVVPERPVPNGSRAG